MLFTFGILAPQTGGFNAPSALTWLSDDRIAVADKERGCFTVFSPTAYAKTIHEGLTAQSELRWDDEFAAWQKTLSINSHFELAHLQIGKVYLDAGNYVQAMEKFRLGGSKELYARAFGKYRADWIYRNIRWILAVFLALILPVAFLVFFRKFKHRRKSRDGG
jgi:dolichyl-phosphate-mannose--protein O-mannosyl transferase